ncbi:MAG: DUF4097 family beta strand repeat-containing protein, partial [Gemmatimonadales bacterium]
ILLAPAAAGQGRVLQDHEWCDRGDRDRGWACEVREFTLPARGDFDVDARPNGGIEVVAWDRNEIRVLARVSSQADSDADARSILDEVQVGVSGSSADADGPRTGRGESWSVSYRVSVPARIDLSLESTNGGITIDGVSGNLDFRTTNGGVKLSEVAGDVRGRTTNGGLHVELAGSAWQGSGLDVQTTNGGVTLVVPDGYDAHLEAGTTNGGLRFDFPVTVQGRIDRTISTDLGDGGAPIRVRTTNGGVSVERK